MNFLFFCSSSGRCLVEETESHVVIGLLLLLFLLLLLGSLSSGAASGSTTGSSTATATAGNGGELGRALRDEL